MKMKKVVTIGGGTGSFMLLSGLKKYPIEISAIVSMADDGGSTGMLRDELGVLPPGDVRQCLVALSDSSETLRELMNYRFEEGGLKGHNFGNLLLSALEKIEGGFTQGVAEAAKILNVRGAVIPVTHKDTNLYIKLKNGKLLEGEEQINHNFEIEKIGIARNYLKPKAKANPEAIEKISEADLIVIGPGNHYCSIVPNFLVEGIADAIVGSKAKVVYNCNLANKKGHTENFSLDTYLESLGEYLPLSRIDFATFNATKPDAKLVKRYAEQHALLIRLDETRKKRDFRIVRADLLSRMRPKYSKSDVTAPYRAFIRHDSDKLAKVLMMIMELGEYENIIRDII